MKSLMICAAAISLAGEASAAPLASAAPVPPLRAAVEIHLAAISARDMDALLPTLTSGDSLTMIAPNGYKFDTRQKYIDFHRNWFAAKDDGKLEVLAIARIIESPALGHALIKYRYNSRDQAGKMQAAVSWLALTFVLEKDSWRLIFDQNTLIDNPVDKFERRVEKRENRP